jgi:hypothetical protein
VNERLSPQGRETWRWLFLLLFAPKYQPCVGSPLQIFLGFRTACASENSKEPGCSWLFLAVFEKAGSAADRKCMAAGDYQFDSEIASDNSYLSNHLEGRSGAWPSLCHAPQTAASGGELTSHCYRDDSAFAPIPVVRAP